MPALQRRHHSPDLRRSKVTAGVDVHPMVKTGSQSSGEEMGDLMAQKQFGISPAHLKQLPARYESDEESVSPCPEDYEDTSAFSDVDIESFIDLESDELPSIAEVRRVSLTKAPSKPLLVNISKLAPIEKRSTPAHVRPSPQAGTVTVKTSIGRTVVMRSAQNGTGASFQPAVVSLQRPPLRFRPPPPVPPRNEARIATPSPATPTAPQYYTAPALQQRAAFPARKPVHTSRPSVSTVSTRDSICDTDDGNSSVADDSSISSAPSSVADDADLASRYIEMGVSMKSPEEEARKDSTAIRDQQDVDLERAINDYMMWRSEGSPGEPPESVYRLSNEDRQIVRDHEEEEWKRELEKGLATPTPTTYAAYDPFGMNPPSLARPKAPFQGESLENLENGRSRGIRMGLGMNRRSP